MKLLKVAFLIVSFVCSLQAEELFFDRGEKDFMQCLQHKSLDEQEICLAGLSCKAKEHIVKMEAAEQIGYRAFGKIVITLFSVTLTLVSGFIANKAIRDSAYSPAIGLGTYAGAIGLLTIPLTKSTYNDLTNWYSYRVSYEELIAYKSLSTQVNAKLQMLREERQRTDWRSER